MTSKTLVERRGLSIDSPGIIDTCTKGRKAGVLCISLPVSVYPYSCTLQTSGYDLHIDFCVNSASLVTSFERKSATSP